MSNKTERLEIRCKPKLRAALERVAEAQDMTLSDVIRAALEDYVTPYQGVKVPVMGTIGQGGIVWKSQEVTK